MVDIIRLGRFLVIGSDGLILDTLKLSLVRDALRCGLLQGGDYGFVLTGG